MIRLTAYCLDWHISQSRAFHELLVEPLKPFLEVSLTAWDGISNVPLEYMARAEGEPVIFCQRPPSPEVLRRPEARLIWIPMWDNVVSLWNSERWWASLPKTLRIVAFSEGVERKAYAAGLPVLRLRFHKSPSQFDVVDFKRKRILYYWNRTGLFGPRFIEKLCRTIDVSEIYFRDSVDPKIARGAAYALPPKIGKTVVHQISGFETQADYFDVLRRCNIYLAPRSVEGVGLNFLEAMSGGLAVMAYDAPTMNEYIDSKVDGFLFSNSTLEKEPANFLQKAGAALVPRQKLKDRLNYIRISLDQNWNCLADLNLATLGHAAREKQATGSMQWKTMLPEYADFILNW